ncbi:MAG: hypothetical protein COA78_10980 [Blastopirellula sp.]|nr:MAG: hypothetical protein COA78_10980 [Blastopirellula sp.]
MREFFKGVILVILLGSLISIAVGWGDDRPTQFTWILRLGSPVISLLAMLLFLKVHFRRDEVPDYLHKLFGGFFDRDGFCFTFLTGTLNGVCYIEVYFQNKYERPCIGRIALQPAKGFFGRKRIDAIICEVECDAAGFGVARIPVPLPLKVQGKKQKFEVGACVKYPNGKGRMLRFRDSMFIRTNSEFGDALGTTLAVGYILAGGLVIQKPATVTISLPADVAQEIPDGLKPEFKTLWKLGDPPLKGELDTF